MLQILKRKISNRMTYLRFAVLVYVMDGMFCGFICGIDI